MEKKIGGGGMLHINRRKPVISKVLIWNCVYTHMLHLKILLRNKISL